jgi:hypothetical protein
MTSRRWCFDIMVLTADLLKVGESVVDRRVQGDNHTASRLPKAVWSRTLPAVDGSPPSTGDGIADD